MSKLEYYASYQMTKWLLYLKGKLVYQHDSMFFVPRTSKQYQETKKLVVDFDFSALDTTTQQHQCFFWNSIPGKHNTVNPLLLL